ncbi:Uma2 family endonuclease [Streptomyces sp. NPDC001930]|uniref:Uma2 family endonuclease n=1 Tax=Streptomyces sp. NPDC001930 TaxID=3364625 RepID=UPI00367DF6FD
MTTVEQVFELFSAQEPEGWRVELVEGEICVTGPGDGRHAETVAELRDRLYDGRSDPDRQSDPDGRSDPDRQIRGYTGIGLRVPGRGPDGRLVPDLTLAPKGSFRNELVWHAPDPVLLVAEVTSPSTARRDRVQKIRAYARGGIPLYLLIDREAGEAVVCSGPSGDDYGHKSVHKLGTQVPLPAPLGFTLDTAEF